MAFTGPAQDRLLIRELYGTYSDASWRGDREQWVGCFAHDGRWSSHLFDVTGHQALRETWDDVWKDWDAVAFMGEVGAMEIDGNCATARSYTREIVKMKNGSIFKLCGRYDDSLVRVESDWKFQWRAYTVIIAEFPE